MIGIYVSTTITDLDYIHLCFNTFFYHKYNIINSVNHVNIAFPTYIQAYIVILNLDSNFIPELYYSPNFIINVYGHTFICHII